MIKEEIPAIEAHAVETGEGKTTISMAIEDYCRAKGRDPTVVRIESGSIAGASRTGEVFIPTERILDAADIDGGAFGAWDPLWEANRVLRVAPRTADHGLGGGDNRTCTPSSSSPANSKVCCRQRVHHLQLGRHHLPSVIDDSRRGGVRPDCKGGAGVPSNPGAERQGWPFDNFAGGSPEAKAYEALMPEAQKWAGRLLVPRIEGTHGKCSTPQVCRSLTP